MSNNINKEDFDNSFEHYKEVLESKDSKKMEELSTLYKNTFPNDIGDYFTYQDRSITLLEKAVECTTDTKILIKTGDTKRYGTDYDGKYPRKALELYKRAADLGDCEAMMKIVSMYENEFSEENTNYKKSLYWIRKAIAKQYPPSFYKLGCYYDEGKGVSQNSDHAYDLWEKGEKLGDDNCICRLHPFSSYY